MHHYSSPLWNAFDAVMSRIRYRHMAPPESVTDAELNLFEQQLGYSLPSSYRLFLMKYGLTTGTGDIRFTSLGSPGEIETSVEVFYGFKAGDLYDLRGARERYSDELPSHLLPIASGSGGQFLLSLSGADNGTIYWWLPEYGPVESMDNLEPIADSFERFINSLVSVEE